MISGRVLQGLVGVRANVLTDISMGRVRIKEREMRVAIISILMTLIELPAQGQIVRISSNNKLTPASVVLKPISEKVDWPTRCHHLNL